ncbi:MAG: DUF1559 domain-containing protein [Pirellulaceae bacterium]|nr:DUF1559 domain-containing protein [Pirellulaceae bacterium]
MNDQQSGFFNMLAVVCCAALVVATVLPSIVRHRTVARSTACANNLSQLGLGIHNYHSAYKQLPPGCGGTTGDDIPEKNNAGRLGPLVAISPFVEQQRLWEQIANPLVNATTGDKFPAMGPVPWFDADRYTPWSQSPEVYQCPESFAAEQQQPDAKVVFTLTIPGEHGSDVTTCYVTCYGDGTENAGALVDPEDFESVRRARANNRGMFQAGLPLKFRDMLDGLSNTIMLSETIASVQGKQGISGIAKNVANLSEEPRVCLDVLKDPTTQWWAQGRGSRWSDGLLAVSGFQTVLPPNSPSCTSELGMFDSVVAASSSHDGGVHVLFGDGAVKFITNTIDCGDLSVPGVALGRQGASAPGSQSPYGIWGALGTRASKETIDRNVGEVVARDRRNVFARGRVKAQPLSTWTSKSGDERLQARFVRILDQKTIELEGKTGVLHRVPLNTLAAKDIYRAVQMDLLAKQRDAEKADSK